MTHETQEGEAFIEKHLSIQCSAGIRELIDVLKASLMNIKIQPLRENVSREKSVPRSEKKSLFLPNSQTGRKQSSTVAIKRRDVIRRGVDNFQPLKVCIDPTRPYTCVSPFCMRCRPMRLFCYRKVKGQTMLLQNTGSTQWEER